MRYEEYMQSREWQISLELLLCEHGKKCDLCPRTYELQVHHLNYERLGCERIEDVMVLCVRCHNDLHNALRQYTATEKAIRQFTQVTQTEFITRFNVRI